MRVSLKRCALGRGHAKAVRMPGAASLLVWMMWAPLAAAGEPLPTAAPLPAPVQANEPVDQAATLQMPDNDDSDDDGPDADEEAADAVPDASAPARPASRARARKDRTHARARATREQLQVRLLLDQRQPAAKRARAARTLMKMPGTAAGEALTQAAVQDPSARVRRQCLVGLAARGERADVLATALRTDVSRHVRATAAAGLGRMGERGSLYELVLVGALEDPSVTVASTAAKALARVGTASVLPHLLHPTREDARVRRACRSAAATLRHRLSTETPQQTARREKAVFERDPNALMPLMRGAFTYGGAPLAVAGATLAGGVLGTMLTLTTSQPNAAPWLFPLGALSGGVVGGAMASGYVVLRRGQVPLTDAALVLVHGSSGMMAGVGYGLWLGKTGHPAYGSALGTVGGVLAGVVTAAAVPWLKPRPSVVAASMSGSALSGAVAMLGYAALGRNALNEPERVLGVALMAQAAGAAGGTVLSAGLPVTSLQLALMDGGALMGAGVAGGGAFIVSAVAPLQPGISLQLAAGGMLAGMAVGGGAGLLAGALLPDSLEHRLTGGLLDTPWPVHLMPAAPSLVLNPTTGKPNGAVMPLASGTLW